MFRPNELPPELNERVASFLDTQSLFATSQINKNGYAATSFKLMLKKLDKLVAELNWLIEKNDNLLAVGLTQAIACSQEDENLFAPYNSDQANEFILNYNENLKNLHNEITISKKSNIPELVKRAEKTLNEFHLNWCNIQLSKAFHTPNCLSFRNITRLPADFLKSNISLLNNFKKIVISNSNNFEEVSLTNIPNEISLLKNVELLDLSSNNIKYLPPSILIMKNLKILNISNNPCSKNEDSREVREKLLEKNINVKCGGKRRASWDLDDSGLTIKRSRIR